MFLVVQHVVVHRDLKSSNIFVPEPPAPLKLLDFGLAESSRVHHTTRVW